MSQLTQSEGVSYRRHKRTRFWAVVDRDGSLLAVVVYKKGAQALAVRLAALDRIAITESGRAALDAAEREAGR